MRIYKDNKIEKLLLNPDDYYHDYDIHSKLYEFYKTLSIPDHVDDIIGMHIRFEIISYTYELNYNLYQNLSSKVLDKIQDYINNENSYMYFDESNNFYIVMFNENEEDLCHAIKQLYNEIKKYQFKYNENNYSINIKTGIYYAPKNINAYYLYEASQNVLNTSLKHYQSYLSIYHSFH